MRPPYCVLLFLILGPAFALAVFASAPAAQSRRAVTFINAGTEPIYAIRIGHHAAAAWSEDLLGPTSIVDVGDGQTLRVDLHDTCWYDVRFEYRGTPAGELDNVDLCSATRVFLK